MEVRHRDSRDATPAGVYYELFADHAFSVAPGRVSGQGELKPGADLDNGDK